MNLIDLISKHPVPVTRFQRPYVIAEAGVNHEGSMDIARRLIDEAALGGADAIKFQTYKAGTLASKHSPAYWDTSKEPTPSQYELFKKHDSFWKGEFENLKKHCDQAGIAFMSTPFDVESAKFLNDMMDVFKISSSDLTNRPFIEFMCDFKKPIIMSTGAASLAEIAEAHDGRKRRARHDPGPRPPFPAARHRLLRPHPAQRYEGAGSCRPARCSNP